jgi:hypothetical protein
LLLFEDAILLIVKMNDDVHQENLSVPTQFSLNSGIATSNYCRLGIASSTYRRLPYIPPPTSDSHTFRFAPLLGCTAHHS